jgi:hypothetical protein
MYKAVYLNMQSSYSVPLEQGWLHHVDTISAAAGDDFVIPALPTMRRVLNSLTFIFTASGVAGNRLIRLEMGVGTTPYCQWKTNATITAGQAHQFFLNLGFPSQEVSIGQLHYGPLFNGVIMHQHFSLWSVTTGILAGDQFSAILYSCSEWPEYIGT